MESGRAPFNTSWLPKAPKTNRLEVWHPCSHHQALLWLKRQTFPRHIFQACLGCSLEPFFLVLAAAFYTQLPSICSLLPQCSPEPFLSVLSPHAFATLRAVPSRIPPSLLQRPKFAQFNFQKVLALENEVANNQSCRSKYMYVIMHIIHSHRREKTPVTCRVNSTLCKRIASSMLLLLARAVAKTCALVAEKSFSS